MGTARPDTSGTVTVREPTRCSCETRQARNDSSKLPNRDCQPKQAADCPFLWGHFPPGKTKGDHLASGIRQGRGADAPQTHQRSGRAPMAVGPRNLAAGKARAHAHGEVANVPVADIPGVLAVLSSRRTALRRIDTPDKHSFRNQAPGRQNDVLSPSPLRSIAKECALLGAASSMRWNMRASVKAGGQG